ncbi:cupin domain-containing protein [uncultured Jatrophihabitans sp.]|uniref:cupin domain-containing protein n=1 Tax=uncultured Jatrophihabitans sp. TaxID=1610747 RepID=UPI0035C97276
MTDTFAKLYTQSAAGLEWVPAEMFALPEGCEYKIFKDDGGDGLRAVMVRFPPGYVEPEHQHAMEHWGIVIEGEMHVDGKKLGPGDFHFAPANVLHGPFYYPKGCIVFGTTHSFQPDGMRHDYTAEAAQADPRDIEVSAAGA